MTTGVKHVLAGFGPKMFNNDSTLTAAILDRLLHHAETVVIEGKSFRMRGQIEP